MQQRPASIAILQNHSLTMLVQRELERMVLAGELVVGEKLNELALASRLGVSRGPVREALRALGETGLVRLEKNRGVFVREVSVMEADEIFEVRATLDQLAGRKLACTIQPKQLAELRAIVARMRKAATTEDQDGYHSANLRFHDALVEFAGNEKLLQMYRRLVNELSLYRRHTLSEPQRLRRSTLEHQKILGLIVAGDADGAGQMLHDHAMASRARMHAFAATSGAAVQTPLASNS
jgi:phosphonate utilization transcriptional regulator